MIKRDNITTHALLVLWFALASTGTVAMLAYSEAPGAIAAVPSDWPTDSKLTRADGRAALVMSVHPQCPCSRASLAELARAVVTADAGSTIYVLLVRPDGTPDDWSNTPTADAARQIPNVRVIEDAKGIESKRFGAETSGHAVLFDRDGRRVFSGGITSARGHEGATPASSVIASTLSSKPTSTAPGFTAPVYGCGLGNRPAAEARQ